MARVPTREDIRRPALPRYSPASIPTPRLADPGAGFQALASGLDDAAGTIDRMHDRYSQAQVVEQETWYRERVRELLEGEDGYTTTNGRDALDRREPTQEELRRLREEAQARLTENPRAARVFEERANELDLQFNGAIDRHANRQGEAYLAETDAAYATLSAQDFARTGDASFLDGVTNAVQSRLDAEGIPEGSPQYNLRMTEAIGAAISERAAVLAGSGEPEGLLEAEAMLRQYGEILDPAATSRAQAALRRAALEHLQLQAETDPAAFARSLASPSAAEQEPGSTAPAGALPNLSTFRLGPYREVTAANRTAIARMHEQAVSASPEFDAAAQAFRAQHPRLAANTGNGTHYAADGRLVIDAEFAARMERVIADIEAAGGDLRSIGNQVDVLDYRLSQADGRNVLLNTPHLFGRAGDFRVSGLREAQVTAIAHRHGVGVRPPSSYGGAFAHYDFSLTDRRAAAAYQNPIAGASYAVQSGGGASVNAALYELLDPAQQRSLDRRVEASQNRAFRDFRDGPLADAIAYNQEFGGTDAFVEEDLIEQFGVENGSAAWNAYRLSGLAHEEAETFFELGPREAAERLDQMREEIEAEGAEDAEIALQELQVAQETAAALTTLYNEDPARYALYGDPSADDLFADLRQAENPNEALDIIAQIADVAAVAQDERGVPEGQQQAVPNAVAEQIGSMIAGVGEVDRGAMINVIHEQLGDDLYRRVVPQIIAADTHGLSGPSAALLMFADTPPVTEVINEAIRWRDGDGSEGVVRPDGFREALAIQRRNIEAILPGVQFTRLHTQIFEAVELVAERMAAQDPSLTATQATEAAFESIVGQAFHVVGGPNDAAGQYIVNRDIRPEAPEYVMRSGVIERVEDPDVVLEPASIDDIQEGLQTILSDAALLDDIEALEGLDLGGGAVFGAAYVDEGVLRSRIEESGVWVTDPRAPGDSVVLALPTGSGPIIPTARVPGPGGEPGEPQPLVAVDLQRLATQIHRIQVELQPPFHGRVDYINDALALLYLSISVAGQQTGRPQIGDPGPDMDVMDFIRGPLQSDNPLLNAPGAQGESFSDAFGEDSAP